MRFGQRSDKAVEIARLEVVGVLCEAKQFGYAEIRCAGTERVGAGECSEGRPTTGAAAANGQRIRDHA